ncbi:MAG: hypothetical protein E3J23_08735 [Candidatus Stahlbacteria bacterium]|nr:MAG: hypothetical protein E3J23_08735 [Candidatus Stahlbacteria bacterium]
MEIRTIKKDYKIFKKYSIPKECVLTLDDTLNQSVIMIQTEKGKLQEWTRGRKNIESFLVYGYVRIQKNCPHRIGKCICEKCSLFVIKNGTGDCAHVWSLFRK